MLPQEQALAPYYGQPEDGTGTASPPRQITALTLYLISQPKVSQTYKGIIAGTDRKRGIRVREVAEKPLSLDPASAAIWLAQAQAEYERLLSSLAALATQLNAMGATIQSASAAEHHPIPAQEGTETQPLIRVNMLGPFQLDAGGRSYGPGVPGQVRTVLEYLVSQGKRPTPKDALLDLLWPDAGPQVACSRLRVVMHTLRKSIPCKELGIEELVVSAGNNFMLNPQVGLWVDVAEFEQHWRNGWRLGRAGNLEGALHEYEQAEALYIGDYLEDEPYADWTLLRREALRDAYASILTMLATMSVKEGDYTGAIIWSQKLLAQDNCREDAYRLLIVSHSRLGQRNRALYWYGLCAGTLQKELGMEPSSETQSIYSRILVRE